MQHLPWLLQLQVLQVPGIEADDAIATLAKRAVEADMEVIIVTADKVLGRGVLVFRPEQPGTARMDPLCLKPRTVQELRVVLAQLSAMLS